MIKRAQIRYSGYVQGVGFRFTAVNMARNLGLVGWVKNLPRGEVEVVCEGEERIIKKFILKIAGGPLGGHVRDNVVEWTEPTGEFSNFEIRF